MSIVLQSSGGGQITLQEPSTASNFTQTLPAGTGTVAVQGASTNIVSGTAVASTSGTSIDFTSIPSWVKRVTVMFNGVSLSATANIRVQLGVSGTPETTGYTAGSNVNSNIPSSAFAASASGIDMFGGQASYAIHGSLVLTTLGSNIWTAMGVTYNVTTVPYIQQTAGSKALAGTLNMIRITTDNGTDTFDAGSINILYE